MTTPFTSTTDPGYIAVLVTLTAAVLATVALAAYVDVLRRRARQAPTPPSPQGDGDHAPHTVVVTLQIPSEPTRAPDNPEPLDHPHAPQSLPQGAQQPA